MTKKTDDNEELKKQISFFSSDSSYTEINNLFESGYEKGFPLYSLRLIINAGKSRNLESFSSEGWLNPSSEEKSQLLETRNIKKNPNIKTILLVFFTLLIIGVLITTYFIINNNENSNVYELDEETAWNKALHKRSPSSINRYITMFPRGKHIFEADSIIALINGETIIDNPVQEPENIIRLVLNQDSIKISKGNNTDIKVDITPSNVNYKVSITNSNIADYVSDFHNKLIKLTAKECGNTTIKVYSSDNPSINVSCYISVFPNIIKSESISFIEPINSLIVGEEAIISFNILPENSSTIDYIRLKTSDNAIINTVTSINNTKNEIKIKALKEGVTEIWLELHQSNSENIYSFKHRIKVSNKIIKLADISIRDKYKFARDYFVGEFLPEIKITYEPNNAPQPVIYYYIDKPEILEMVNNKFIAKESGVATIKYYSADNNDIFDKVSITVKEISNNNDNKIYEVVDKMPTFPYKINNYFNNNIKYPLDASEKGIQGTVYLSFIVEKNGNLSDIRIIRGICKSCDSEALRAVKSMPKWNPGKNNNISVRVKKTIPVKFVLK